MWGRWGKWNSKRFLMFIAKQKFSIKSIKNLKWWPVLHLANLLLSLVFSNPTTAPTPTVCVRVSGACQVGIFRGLLLGPVLAYQAILGRSSNPRALPVSVSSPAYATMSACNSPGCPGTTTARYSCFSYIGARGQTRGPFLGQQAHYKLTYLPSPTFQFTPYNVTT